MSSSPSPPPPPGNKKKDKRILSGSCPDPECQARLFFPAHGGPASIECTECGQRYEQKDLQRVEEVNDPDVVLHNLLRHALLGVTGAPKKGPELIKVNGLSNYQCKLLSPVLTRYGMDKATGQARLLSDMGQGEAFDCALLADRAFQIERGHLETVGYGRDRSGSALYLRDTLAEVSLGNGGREALVPVHVDGDGHCLVHAVSRALVGRELFWHALRHNLQRHFAQHLERYRALLSDFLDAADWDEIIRECDPSFMPPDGGPAGLRNVHVFGLANVLRRPIILLDSLSGMRSPGDYSATFLPGLVAPEECVSKLDHAPHRPICLAWSSSAHNHYLPLVAIKGEGLAKLPAHLLPKAWGVPQQLIGRYLQLDAEGSVVIGGERGLGEGYLQRLAGAMAGVFERERGVSAALVAEVQHYVFRRRGVVGALPDEVTASSRRWLEEGRLHRCLGCGGVSELSVPRDWLAPGGKLYLLAQRSHGDLQSQRSYSFPLSSLVCVYDADSDTLRPDYSRSAPAACHACHSGPLRPITREGGVAYRDGDRTNTPSSGGKCGCGFKHWWAGREYDNLPEALPVTLEWAGRVVRETVYWWEYEAEAGLNSNAYEVAARLVHAHFPGEFGSELLVQKVVSSILQQTARRSPDQYTPVAVEHAHAHTHTPTYASHTHTAHTQSPTHTPAPAQAPAPTLPAPASNPASVPSKIILIGQKSRTLHKEELTMSQSERRVQQSIRDNASATQQRRDPKPAAADPPLTTSPAPSSSSLPATPTRTASSEKKVRVTTSDGRQATLTLQAGTNHMEFQRSITEAFGIPAARQRIRVGFPPKPLPLPANANQDCPIALEHGDRVTVEVLPGEASELNGREKDEGRRGGGMEEKARDEEERRREGEKARDREKESEAMSRSQREIQDNIDLEISSLCLLATLMGEDVWSYAKKLPHLFQPGGVFYNIVKKDMGLLDGKHCSLPQLPGRVFVYSSRDDRLELCADTAGHFPISPSVDELANEAGAGRSHESSPSHAAMRLGGGGVVRKKDTGVTAFQGKGHSLGSSQVPPTPDHHPIRRQHSGGLDPISSQFPTSGDQRPISEEQRSGSRDHRPIRRQHSVGMDLSGSVAPPPAERAELVRMAPGFVTALTGKEGRGGGLDPVAIETQRRRLQEMVSSIQASMDKHTHSHTHTPSRTNTHTHPAQKEEEEEEEEDEPMDQS